MYSVAWSLVLPGALYCGAAWSSSTKFCLLRQCRCGSTSLRQATRVGDEVQLSSCAASCCKPASKRTGKSVSPYQDPATHFRHPHPHLSMNWWPTANHVFGTSFRLFRPPPPVHFLRPWQCRWIDSDSWVHVPLPRPHHRTILRPIRLEVATIMEQACSRVTPFMSACLTLAIS